MMSSAQPEPTPILTPDMKRVVREQRLGFVATVCSDGTPNLSPKGPPASGTTSTLSSVTSCRRRP